MKTRPVLIPLAILSIALLSCGGESVTGTGEVSDRNTPEDLLEALINSLEHEDINLYRECLHDAYLFTFTPGDAEGIGLPPAEPWWGKTEDEHAVSSIFNDPMVVEFECDIKIDTGPWQVDDAVGYRLDPDIRCKISRESAPEDTTLWVYNVWLYVEIVADPYEADTWVFRGIREVVKDGLMMETAPSPNPTATPTVTLGSIKARYDQSGLSCPRLAVAFLQSSVRE